MNILLLLLPLLAFSWAQDAPLQDASITDLFQRVLDVENALKDQIKTQYQEAKKAHDDKKAAAEARLNATMQAMEEAFQERKEKYEQAKQQYEADKEAKKQKKIDEINEFTTEIKQVVDAVNQKKAEQEQEKKEKIDELIAQLKQAYKTRQEQKEAEKEQKKEAFKQKLEEMKQKWNDFKTKVQQAKEEKEQKKQQRIEEMKATLSELKKLIEDEAQARADKKAQRKEEEQQQLEQFKTDIQSQKETLDAEAEDLMQKYSAYNEKRETLKETVKNAIHAGMKAKMADAYGDKIQAALDKEAVKRVVSDLIKENEANDAAAEEVIESAQPAAKATILDEITGTSQWQTVTWILLALSILLTVALLALIFYNVSQRHSYERLNGEECQDLTNERTPIARPVAPLGYTQEKSGNLPDLHIVPNAAIPLGYKQDKSLMAAGPSSVVAVGPPTPSGPGITLPPHNEDEIKQF